MTLNLGENAFQFVQHRKPSLKCRDYNELFEKGQ